jgi:TP901 family phage tail tape measure protein
MGAGAEEYQKNVNKYVKKSQDTQRGAIKSVLKEDLDANSQRIESLKKYEKERTKVELEAVRNGGSIRPKAQLLVANQDVKPSAFNSMNANQQSQYENKLAKEFQAINKKREADSRALATKMQNITKIRAQIEIGEEKRIAKEFQKIGKEKVAAIKAFGKNRSAQTKLLTNADKAYEKEYSNWWKSELKKRAVEEKAAKKDAKSAKFQQTVTFVTEDEDFNRRMAATRYALYDVGRRAIAFGAAVAGALALGVASAIKFESAFTSVERTTGVAGQASKELKNTLIDMSTAIPVAFADITEIATLGAQLGIATSDVDEFTETVAKFSAITGIAVETVALSFGRLAELMHVPASEFENLSSAIAFAGVNAVATDAEILKMAESIGSVSAQAGISAADTIGFATALASLKIRPEEARGVFTRLFRTFDLGVASGGEKLDDFAKVIGTTSEGAAALFREDASEFFQQFLEGANATGELNATMTALGITNVRELNVISRLSQNQDVLTSALADSNLEFERASFSTKAYGLVVDDVASKIAIMNNSIQALGASLGESVMEPLAFIVDAITNFTEGLRKAPMPLRAFITVVGALTAGVSLFIGALALGIAGLLAMKLAFQNLKLEGVQAGISINTFRALLVSMIPNAGAATGVLSALSNSFKGVAVSSAVATTGVRRFVVSLGPIVLGLAAVAGIAGVIFLAVEESADKARRAMFEAAGGFDALVTAAKKDTAMGSGIATLVAGTADLNAEVERETRIAKEAIKLRDTEISAIRGSSEATDTHTQSVKYGRIARAELNEEIAATNLLLGENVTALILDSLKNYDGNGANFWVKLTELSPGVRSVLNDIGFSAGQMVSEGLTEGGITAEEYSANFVNAMKLISQSTNALPAELTNLQRSLKATGFDLSIEEIKGFASQLDVSGSRLNALIKFLTEGGRATDGYVESGAEAARATNELAVSQEEMGIQTEASTAEIEAQEAAVLELANATRALVNELTSTAILENKVGDALDTFAKGANETAGELDGMGEAARTNLSNFASFMDAATEASIAAGEGTPGAMRRIIAGLSSLEAAGVDVSDAFTLVKKAVINSIVEIAGNDAALRADLAKQPDLSGMKAIVKAFYEVQLAASVSRAETFNLMFQMARAMKSFEGGTYQIEPFKPVKNSAEKALTALEKLKAMIDKMFKATNNKLDVLNSVESLGESLKKNGTVFSVWTKAGKDNISSLRSTIDSLAEASNGNTQVFANSLGALRQALVKAGVSGTGLKDIDNLIKKTGKTTRVSKNQVNQFYAQIKSSSDARRALLEIADAASKVSSAINAGLSATFAQGNAIDQVTLGWLDLSDAQDAARKSVSDANEAIVEANLSIRATKASIDELTADKGKLQFQLQIAIKYGDTLREDAIRAQLGTIDSEIASKENDITKANSSIANSVQEITDANSKLGIDSNTRDLIAQNLALQDMASKYGTVTAFMLATAKPGTDLNGIIEAQTKAFYDNAIQMGYTETDAKKLSDVLRDELIASLDDIPEDIATTIKADTTGALAAVTKFVQDANARLNTIKDKTVTVTTVQKTVSQSSQGNFKGFNVGFSRGGMVSGPGTATSDSIPARLSNGEYVVRASAVSRYGVDFFNSLNNMQSAPSRMQSAPAQSSGGSQTVFLSTEDRQLLRSAIDRPVALYTDNATIAKSANDGNAILAQRGIR